MMYQVLIHVSTFKVSLIYSTFVVAIKLVVTGTCLCFAFYRKFSVDKPPVFVAIGTENTIA